MIIFARRIWTPSRWPLVHEAKTVFEAGGDEAFRAWADSLSFADKQGIYILDAPRKGF
jgi:hypothetical protein